MNSNDVEITYLRNLVGAKIWHGQNSRILKISKIKDKLTEIFIFVTFFIAILKYEFEYCENFILSKSGRSESLEQPKFENFENF